MLGLFADVSKVMKGLIAIKGRITASPGHACMVVVRMEKEATYVNARLGFKAQTVKNELICARVVLVLMAYAQVMQKGITVLVTRDMKAKTVPVL